MAEGVEWFEGHPDDDRRDVLHALVLSAGRPAPARTMPENIARSGIRPLIRQR
ncbi:hypothetical protein [Streptomyces sp. NPDC093990]|uniref:hypothetical protein n=1 Tax=Streptomyces sp. NPDC093990 TaxID=3155306 RepID=UPI003443C432